MDQTLSSPVRTVSDLSTSSSARIKNTSTANSDYPLWSSRFKCYQAYICFIMSYINMLKFCERIGLYKLNIIIPYAVFHVAVGVPAVFIEIMVGRFVNGNISQVWNMCPAARGIFCCLFLITFFAVIRNYMYNVYLFKYIFASFVMEWEECNKPWTTKSCYRAGYKSKAITDCQKTQSKDYCGNLTWESSGYQYWKYSINSHSDATGIVLSIAFLTISISVAAAIIYKGMRTLEKMLGMLVYPSVALWIILVAVSLSSKHAFSGFKSLFRFSWDTLTHLEMWLVGFEDTLVLLGLGRLPLSFISSHGNFHDNIFLDVLTVIFTSFGSIILTTTALLSSMAYIKELESSNDSEPFFKDVDDVFVSTSEAFLDYPFPQALWAFLYYVDCFLMTLNSQAVMALTLCDSVKGVLNTKEKNYFYIIIVVSLFSFSLTIISSYFEFVNSLYKGTMVIAVMLLLTLTLQMFYGIQKFHYDYFFLMGRPIPVYLKCTFCFLLMVSFVALLLKGYYRVPSSPVNYIVYIYIAIPVFIYIVVLIINIIKTYLKKEQILEIFRANPDWGPENMLLKRSRKVFDKSPVTREFMYRQELYKKPLLKPPDFSKQNIVRLI